MSSISADDSDAAAAPGAAGTIIHPLWVRLTHWINAAAMVAMIMSGWQIYNASPLFGFTFPPIVTLGGWLGGALQWHFAAMWVLVLNGLLYVIAGLVGGRFRRKLLPLSPRGFIDDSTKALAFRLSHTDLSIYNHIQKLLYLGILLVGALVVLSGLAIWKPVQLQYLTAVFGGYDTARYVHFILMALIVGFLVLHVALAVLVPKGLRAMIIGR